MCTTLVTLKTLKLANGICVRCCLRLPWVHSAVCSELKVLNYAPCNRKEHQVGVNVHTVLCTSVHQCFMHRVHQCAQCARVSWKCWGVLHINSLLLGRSAHSMTITMLAIMLMWWTLGEEKERNHLKLGLSGFQHKPSFSHEQTMKFTAIKNTSESVGQKTHDFTKEEHQSNVWDGTETG